METRVGFAEELYRSGFSCAQSVVAVFSEKYGLDIETALKISGGLGGGFRRGEVCGAASGAVLVIGLKYGHYKSDDSELKKICYSKTVEFMKLFEERNRSVVCREILDRKASAKEGGANNNGGGCFDMVESAVSILEELGY